MGGEEGEGEGRVSGGGRDGWPAGGRRGCGGRPGRRGSRGAFRVLWVVAAALCAADRGRGVAGLMGEDARRALEGAGIPAADVGVLEEQGFETLGDLGNLDEARVERLFGGTMLPAHRQRLARLGEELAPKASAPRAESPAGPLATAFYVGVGVAVAGAVLSGAGKQAIDVVAYFAILVWYVVHKALVRGKSPGGEAKRGTRRRRFEHILRAAHDDAATSPKGEDDTTRSRVSLEALSPEERAIYKQVYSLASRESSRVLPPERPDFLNSRA